MKKNCIVIEIDFIGAGNQDETITYSYPKPDPNEAHGFNPLPNISRIFYRAFHLLRNYINAQRIKMPDNWGFYFSEPGTKDVRVSIWDIDPDGEKDCLVTLIYDDGEILAAFRPFEGMVSALYYAKQSIVDFDKVKGRVKEYSDKLLEEIAPPVETITSCFEDDLHDIDYYQSVWLLLEDSDTMTATGIKVNYYHEHNSYIYTGPEAP